MATIPDDIMNKHFDHAGIEREDGNTDNNNEGENNGGDNSTEQDQTQDTGAEGGEGAKGKEGDQSSHSEGDRSGGDKNGKPEQRTDQKGKEKEGKAGDPKDGGKQRVNAEADRWRDQYHVKDQQVKDLNNQLKQMTSSRDTARNRLTEMEKTVQSVNGANPRELSVGVQIVRDMQRDPVGTLRKLLTEAVAAGHTIEGIGQGIDAAAITRLIESRIPQPKTGDGQNTDQAIQQEISQFYSQYPDARVHDEVIARVLTDHPQLSLTEAMFELKSQFAARGLDWNKAITDPANQAALNPSGGQDSKEQQQRDRKPLVNGRGGANPKPADHIAVAHESTSTEDIIREAMRENGLAS